MSLERNRRNESDFFIPHRYQTHPLHPFLPSLDHSRFHALSAYSSVYHASHEVYHAYIFIIHIFLYSIAHPMALLCCIKGIIAERIQLNTFGKRFSSAANNVFIRYRSLGLYMIPRSIFVPFKASRTILINNREIHCLRKLS